MSARRPNGYVSFVAAITVGVLALAVLMFARAHDSLRPAMRRLDMQVQLETAAQSAEARVAYLLATEPLSGAAIVVGGERGLAPGEQIPLSQNRNAAGGSVRHVALDGRAYAWDATLISVQDEAGLLNLNTPDEQAVAALLTASGLSAYDAPWLAATLADYVDEDSERRPGGAETLDYDTGGTALNAALPAPRAALSAYGWRDSVAARTRQTFFAWTSTAPDVSGVNINTAPAEVIEAALGASPTQAQAIVAQRQRQLFRSPEDAQAILGVSARAESAQPSIAPDAHFRIIVQLPDRADAVGWVYESQLVVARGTGERPVYWRQGVVRRAEGVARGQSNGVEALPTGAGVSS
ncbi:MAG: general secretion pathway protein GspK [Hyphomonadaceae bacterium]